MLLHLHFKRQEDGIQYVPPVETQYLLILRKLHNYSHGLLNGSPMTSQLIWLADSNKLEDWMF
jgi:hypothetical protein